MKKECEAWLRGLVPPDETVVAVGTAEELRSLGPDIGSGGGWTFIVVTSKRLLFARWGSPQKPHEEIRYDEITHWASGTQYNCEALVLTHPPMTRRQRVPAYRILWFKWGNAEADVTRTQTIFRLSRPDTQVARALHSALSARSLAHEPLHFEEKSREERTGGSRAVCMRRSSDSRLRSFPSPRPPLRLRSTTQRTPHKDARVADNHGESQRVLEGIGMDDGSGSTNGWRGGVTEAAHLGDERTTLLGFLQHERDVVAWKVRDTPEEVLRSVGTPTGLTLHGLVRHLEHVEKYWFREVFAGEDNLPYAWTDEDPDGEFHVPTDITMAELLTAYAEESARCDAVINAALSLDEVSVRRSSSLRWIILHLIEETSRHLGHIDLLREQADGKVGYRPGSPMQPPSTG